MRQKCPSWHFTQRRGSDKRCYAKTRQRHTEIMTFPNYHTRSFDQSSQDSQPVHTASVQRHINRTVCTMWYPPYIQIHSIKWKTVCFSCHYEKWQGPRAEIYCGVYALGNYTQHEMQSHIMQTPEYAWRRTLLSSQRWLMKAQSNSAPNYHRLQWKGTSD